MKPCEWRKMPLLCDEFDVFYKERERRKLMMMRNDVMFLVLLMLS